MTELAFPENVPPLGLSIQLFGGVRASRGNSFVHLPTRWSAGLLARLALPPSVAVHRDILSSCFWPEESDVKARQELRRALCEVRSVIEPPGVRRKAFLLVDGPYLGLVTDHVRIDLVEFEDFFKRAMGESDRHSRGALLEAAVRLYQGDLMDGYDFPWATPERERLRFAFLAALEGLMDLHMVAGEWSLAIARGQQVLAREPISEHVHRKLMICYYLQGSRPLALRQFRACASILRKEMGIGPMDATRAIIRAMENGSFQNRAPGPDQFTSRNPLSQLWGACA